MFNEKRASLACAMAIASALSSGCVSNPDGQPTASSSATITAASEPSIGSFVVYAAHTVTLGSGDHTLGGGVGVATSTGASPQLTVAPGDVLDVAQTLVAPSISIGTLAVVGAVDTNTLTNNGGIVGTQAGYPAAMPALPSSFAPAPNTTNLTVAAGQTQTLTPGDYGALTDNGAVLLGPGQYSFSSVTLGNGAQLVAEGGGSTTLLVGGALATGTGAQIYPIGQSANHLAIFVSGADGSTPAVSVGANSQVTSLLAAPNGTVSLGNGTQGSGAFAGLNFVAGTNVSLTFQNGFPTQTPSISTFVAYAELSITLGNAVTSTGGDIGVAVPSGAAGAQLSVGTLDIFDGQHSLIAPSVALGNLASVGDIQTNALTNGGGSFGAELPYPVSMPALPLAAGSPAGGSSVNVALGQTTVLSPGNFGALTDNGIVALSPGNYSFTSITLGNAAQLLAQTGGNTSVVTGSLSTGTLSEIAPGLGAAGTFSISVSGTDVGGTPAASVGASGKVTALLAVPHGTLSFGTGAQATGAFAAFYISAGNNVAFTFQSGFPPQAATPPGSQVISSYVLPPASPVVGPVPAGTVIPVAVALQLRNSAQLASVAAEVSDPTNANYKNYVTSTTFMSTYAPLASNYAALVSWATSNGLTVVQYPNNVLADLMGSVANLEQALSVNFVLATRPDGTTFYEPDRQPIIPLPATTNPVLGVSGIDSYVLPIPLVGPGTNTQIPGDLQSSDLRGAYLGGSASSCSGLTGAGQTIGLFEFDGFNPTDITTYESDTHLTGVPAVQVQTTNNSSGLSPGCPTCASGPVAPPLPPDGEVGTIECSGDIEFVIAMAPKAQVIVFEGTNTDSMLENIANNQNVSQISSSWWAGTSAITSTLLSVLAAQGQSFFEATGDNGAYEPPTQTCPPADLAAIDAGTAAAINTPPTDIRSLPFVTLVGGTVLNTSGGTRSSEVAWTPGGGGILPGISMPLYQTGANPANASVSTTNRNVPDISAVAQNLFSVASLCGGSALNWVGSKVKASQCTGSTVCQVINGVETLEPCATTAQSSTNTNFNGTSASAPLWAGYMALVNERNASSGPMGFANPMLYQIGKSTSAAAQFDDITSGNDNNSCAFGYNATTGYDLATGWGTPSCGLVGQLSKKPTILLGVSGTAQGPFVCINGSGFTSGGTVTVQYAGVPEFATPTPTLDVITTSQAVSGTGGSFSMTDNETTTVANAVAAGVSACTASEIASGVVTVDVIDNTTGESASATMPASLWCNINQSTQVGGGCTLPSVTITYQQIGACNGSASFMFSAGLNAAYEVYGIQGIDNSENPSAFNYNPSNLYVQQASGQDFFDPGLMIYADEFGPFASIPATIGATNVMNYSPYGLGATIVSTTNSNGAVEANATSYPLNYKQQSTDPLVVLVNADPTQTTVDNAQDCDNVVPP